MEYVDAETTMGENNMSIPFFKKVFENYSLKQNSDLQKITNFLLDEWGTRNYFRD